MKNTSKKKKRIEEIIKNLKNTIRKEKEKTGGGNKDIIEKLTYKLEDTEDLL